jgi:CDP-diacylglycerol--glycerol-3-phosphate 3-phosphatidyltransferase
LVVSEVCVATVYDLKPAFQRFLRPACQRLARQGVTANQVTVSALLLSGLLGASIALWPEARWPLFSVPVVLFLRMALNAIDGMLAREHRMQSRLGGVLNELGDVISDAVIYLPFALLEGVPAWGIVVVVVLAGISEMAGVVAIVIGAARRYDGPMGKSDRALWFSVLAILLGCGVPTEPWVVPAVWLLISLSVLTIVHRAYRALREAA